MGLAAKADELEQARRRSRPGGGEGDRRIDVVDRVLGVWNPHSGVEDHEVAAAGQRRARGFKCLRGAPIAAKPLGGRLARAPTVGDQVFWSQPNSSALSKPTISKSSTIADRPNSQSDLRYGPPIAQIVPAHVLGPRRKGVQRDVLGCTRIGVVPASGLTVWIDAEWRVPRRDAEP